MSALDERVAAEAEAERKAEHKRRVDDADAMLQLHLDDAARQIVVFGGLADEIIKLAEEKCERILTSPKRVMEIAEKSAAEERKIGQGRHDQRDKAARKQHAKTMKDLGA